MKKIGIITSGGDCGGLNAVIKGAAGMGNTLGIDVVVIPNGYAGLYNLVDVPKGNLTSLSPLRTSLFGTNIAGSEAGHSRVKIKKISDKEKYKRIKEGLKKHDIDALIVSGGDDSGSVAADLASNKIPVVHAPKTMDMDLQPYSVGADSTMNIIGKMAGQLRTTGRSHNRVIILDVFGRYSGHSAFRGGVAADADAIVIPEIAPDFDVIYKHMFNRFTERILKSDVHAGWYLIVCSEAMKGDPKKETVNEHGYIVDKTGWKDAFGHYPLVGAGNKIASELKERMKKDPKMEDFMKKAHLYVDGQYEVPEVRVIKPTHLVRAGDTSAFDANFGKEAGASMVYLLNEGITGVTFVQFQNGRVDYMPIADAIKIRNVDLDEVAIQEATGICFGREFKKFKPKGVKELKKVDRHL